MLNADQTIKLDRPISRSNLKSQWSTVCALYPLAYIHNTGSMYRLVYGCKGHIYILRTEVLNMKMASKLV